MQKKLVCMTKKIDFYFDFGSPYSYLAHKQIQKLEKEMMLEVNYMPILLGAILKMTGVKANADVPVKGKYMIKDCKLWAEKQKIEFKFNIFFPIITLNLMRGVLVAEEKKISKLFIDKIFDAIWLNGLNLNENKTVEKVLKLLKLDPKFFLADLANTKIKEDLRKRTNDAFIKGVFGAPTFIVNNKIFWGQDRLDFALNEMRK
mgnify:CR=1 FL=1